MRQANVLLLIIFIALSGVVIVFFYMRLGSSELEKRIDQSDPMRIDISDIQFILPADSGIELVALHRDQTFKLPPSESTGATIRYKGINFVLSLPRNASLHADASDDITSHPATVPEDMAYSSMVLTAPADQEEHALAGWRKLKATLSSIEEEIFQIRLNFSTDWNPDIWMQVSKGRIISILVINRAISSNDYVGSLVRHQPEKGFEIEVVYIGSSTDVAVKRFVQLSGEFYSLMADAIVRRVLP